MRKKIAAIIFISCLLVFLTSSFILAEQPITIYFNGNVVESDVPPQIIDGRTMVPLRAISEAMGYDVAWNGEYKRVTISDKVKTTPPEIAGPADFVETVQGALDLIKQKDSSLYYWIAGKVDKIDTTDTDAFIAFANTNMDGENIITFSTHYFDMAKANNDKQELILIHVAILTHETNHLYLGTSNILSQNNTEAACDLAALRAIKSIAGTDNKVYKAYIQSFNDNLDL